MKRRQFLQAAGLGFATTAVAMPAVAQTNPAIKWRLTASWPKTLDIAYGACETFAKMVAEATDNQFRIQSFAAGEIIPGLQALDAVSNGTVEACHTAAYYYIGKDPTFALFCAVPFGLNQRQQYAWFYDGDGMKLMNEFGKKFNIYSLVGEALDAIPLRNCLAARSSEETFGIQFLKSIRRLVPWAALLCDEAEGAYVETTVSGTGVRIIGSAAGPELHRRFAFDRDGAGAYRNTPRYITVSALEVGSCPQLPAVDGLLDDLFARYAADDRQAPGIDFSNAGSPQLTLDDIEALIRNDGHRSDDRSRDFARVVWSLAAKDLGVDDIIARLGKHSNGIGGKYAGRLAEEVRRCIGKWQQSRQREGRGGLGFR